jgi:hypothetical protein
VKVLIRTNADKAKLKANLFLDSRQHGSHGRALTCDLPEYKLLKGDRLEPSVEVQDTHDFESLPLPVTLTFWRPSAGGMTHHRNPLFAPDIHVSLQDTIAIDWLHTFSLGIFQDFVGTLVNTLISKNAWAVPQATADTTRKLSISRLQAGLFAFYGMQSRCGIVHTAVQRLDDSTFGSFTDPKCKLHGAETNGLLAYCAVLIGDFRHLLDSAPIWERTCRALLRLRELSDMEAANFTAGHVQEPSRFAFAPEKRGYQTKRNV